MFGIAGDILVVGYDDDGRDHDNMLRRVLHMCRVSKSTTKQRSVISYVHLSHIFARSFPDMVENQILEN